MFILEWLEIAVSWILVTFHAVLTPIFGAASGAAWGLSIVGLVIVIRTLLIPLFVKQIKAQRNLQILQPQMKEIQKKYAGDKERQSQEMMKLYRETGTNPLSSCLPILVQAPIFFALFRVLQGMAQDKAVGVLTPELVAQGREASIFGVPIYGTFLNANETPNPTATHVVTLVMIILMSATTFITQRQLIVKNTAADNPMVRQQKILLYVFPVMFAVGGINFPLGVLLYWLTTNLWSMGQQFYVIRNNPQPGTPAHEAKMKRDAEKAAKKNTVTTAVAEPVASEVVEPPKPTRNQPKRQPRKKRKGR
ncbi:MAG: membrane protein insertase YidC [Actinobacteria bacterium]|jgi:YidC/Oxa1 family membrane protein insertase|nr:membrane protein insertase YidC [Actinomycetota bacterium]MCO5299946.1 membrane protein insertase YidC [Candidatus Nanopelagicales bacterium]MCB9429766.1 membrane protein insertase YidC [Actinomycetota bacterium]HPE11927.1 membrane protein insertase YidC [Actinomycetota bacterium]HPJ17641.1 membrane protein insertase YidC [Actinomycetota bacterium]